MNLFAVLRTPFIEGQPRANGFAGTGFRWREPVRRSCPALTPGRMAVMGDLMANTTRLHGTRTGLLVGLPTRKIFWEFREPFCRFAHSFYRGTARGRSEPRKTETHNAASEETERWPEISGLLLRSCFSRSGCCRVLRRLKHRPQVERCRGSGRQGELRRSQEAGRRNSSRSAPRTVRRP